MVGQLDILADGDQSQRVYVCDDDMGGIRCGVPVSAGDVA